MPDGAEQSSGRGSETLQIGVWTVEPGLNQLSASGRTLKLEPKAMALLRYLAERPGQVVSRDALLSAIWPGVVVGDDSLTQAVIKLRKALGDTADSPAYIQTIPKGGYRLVAPVGRPETIASAPVAPDPESAPRTERQRRVRWLAPAGVIALLLAAAGVWWIAGDGLSDLGGVSPDAPAFAGAERARAAQPTISIRPFEGLGEDPQAVLLARGITADLVTDLSKVFGLSVITAAQPAAPGDAEPAAAAPSIHYLVSGSVQRVDDRLRLHVHLTDGQTGKQIWSERFDRPLSGLFAMQEELGPRILQILPAKVSEAELRRVAQHHTRNLEAYEYFQRGQMALLVRQQAENEIAREMFWRAIKLDSAFARAYAALALTYAADYRNQWTRDGAAALERAFELARTAHEINPDIRETYWVLGFVHLERREHKQAMQHLETAIRLSPSFGDAYALMAGINAYTGRPADALPLARIAMRLNPEAGYLYFLILGRAYFGLGNLELARVNLEHALLRNPVSVEARVYLAALHVAAGNKADAAWEADEIRALQPGFSSRGWLATHPLTDIKVQTKLVQALGDLGL
jgi:DNA-binding winged helix-turn-helix (wHTH) protein/TolB-like protein/Tfp pilus assembly protein PilF